MNSTPAEFRRALLQAFGDAVSEDSTGLMLSVGVVRLHFALFSEMPKQIGALQLASLRVEVNVREGERNAAASLLETVDRATQRGGG